jgi:outer membrane protein TolC
MRICAANRNPDREVDKYLPSLDAQRSLYGAEIGLISLKLARSNAELSLYKALDFGGGLSTKTDRADTVSAIAKIT